MTDLGEEGMGANINATQGVGNGGMAAAEKIQPAQDGHLDLALPAVPPELYDNEYYRRKLEDERAKRKEFEDRYSKLRLEAILNKAYFGNVKISKENFFPLLYNTNSTEFPSKNFPVP